MKYRNAKMILLFSDARGIYIPQQFATDMVRSRVTGVSDDDYATLEAGPEHEWYWETWVEVLDRATVTDDAGIVYTLFQDGDCWAVEQGAEFNYFPARTGCDDLFVIELPDSQDNQDVPAGDER